MSHLKTPLQQKSNAAPEVKKQSAAPGIETPGTEQEETGTTFQQDGWNGADYAYGKDSTAKQMQFQQQQIPSVNPVKTDDILPTVVYRLNLVTGEVTVVKEHEFANGELQFRIDAYTPIPYKGNGYSFHLLNGSFGGISLIEKSASQFTTKEETTLQRVYASTITPMIAREKELEALHIKQGGIKLTDKTSTFDFDGEIESKLKQGNKLDKGKLKANESTYFREVGLPMYLRMRQTDDIVQHGETIKKNVWDVKGALFVLSQAVGEQGYATRKNGNYWGVGGESNNQTLGSSFDQAFDYWIDFLYKGNYVEKLDDKRDGNGWQNAVKLLESGDFTTDKMNKALFSGRFVETGPERNTSGNYSYNGDTIEKRKEQKRLSKASEVYYKDPKAKGELHTYINYAGGIIDSDVMQYVVLRFAKFLKEEITTLDGTKKTDVDTRYKVSLYNTVLYELGEFMKNDYQPLLKTRDGRDAG